MVPMCFLLIDSPTDMQHDQLGSSRDLDPSSNFGIDLSRSTCVYFDASRRKEHDGAQIMSLALLTHTILCQKIYCDLS